MAHRKKTIAVGLISVFILPVFAQDKGFDETELRRRRFIGDTDAANYDRLNVETIGRWPHGHCYAVAAAGQYVYFGDGCVFTVVDISDPAQPAFIGSLELPGRVQDIYVQDPYAYVADYTSGLRVVSISDPANPQEVGSYEPEGDVYGVHVEGDYAYVAGWGFMVFNVSDPTTPGLISADFTTTAARGVHVSDGHAYLVDEYKGFYAFSLENPAAPVMVGRYEGIGWAEDVYASGDYAYAVTRNTGFHVIDVSDPAAPNEVRNYSMGAYGVFVEDDAAYVGGWSQGLYVFDVSDPSQSVILNTLDTPGFATQVFAMNQAVYVADRQSGLRIVDCADPYTPVELGSYATADEAYAVHVQGDYAYVAHGYDGLRVFDVTDPAQPQEVGRAITDSRLGDVFVHGDYAYTLGYQSSTFRVFSVVNPANPVQVNQLYTEDWCHDIYVTGGYAYVAVEDEGLFIYSLSSPANPVEVGSYDTPVSAYGVFAVGNYAYVADHTGGLLIISVADPAHPVEVSHRDVGGAAVKVFVEGDFAYVARAFNGDVRIIRVSDPEHPVEVGAFSTPSYAQDVMVSNGYAYVSDWIQGLFVYDVSDPFNPTQAGYFYSPGEHAGRVFVSDGLAYLANAETGLDILKLQLPNRAPGAPILLSPSSHSCMQDIPIRLSWQVPQDPNGDDLHFKVELASNSSFSTDVKTYESKKDTANFSPVPPVPSSGDSASYTIQDTLEEGLWYWRVSAWDGQIYGTASSVWDFSIDQTPPYTDSHNPAVDATYVAVNSDIVVHVKDDVCGVDQSSIIMQVDGTVVTPTITGSPVDYTLTYDPPSDFGYNETVTVSIDARDKVGNAMPTETYGFTTATEANAAPASPTPVSPVDGAYTKDNTPSLTFDVPADVNGDALHFMVEISEDGDFGTETVVYESKSSTAGFSPTPPVAQGSGQVTYTVQTMLTDGDWWWRVSAWDGTMYGSPSDHRKFIVDTAAPYTTGHDPARNATGVPANASIALHIKDDESGVDQSSVAMTVNGGPVTPVISGHPDDYTVSYTPSSDFSDGQTVSVTLNGTDNAGNSMAQDAYSFQIQGAGGDSQPPTIIHTSTATASIGQDLAIGSSISDNMSVSSATLYYRQGGALTFSSALMDDIGGDTYQGTIPAAWVTERGLEYYISAADLSGNSTTSPSVNPTTSPYVIQVAYSSFTCPYTTPANSYRMISVPSNLDNASPGSVLVDNLGSHDRSEWRLIRDQNEAYVEFGVGSIQSFNPGYGFWLITRSAREWGVGSGKSVTTSGNFSITLTPGWNQIGNPFAFMVNWNDVTGTDHVENPVGYEGTGNNTSGYRYDQSQLVSWKGYYVKNLLDSPVTIDIPPIASSVSAEKNSLADWILEEGDWIVRIKAESGRAADLDNYVGCLSDADDRWDKHDFSEAPPFGEYVSLSFPHDEWERYPGRYTGDFRSPTSEGNFWDFDVRTNVRDSEVLLSFENVGEIPPRFTLSLLDRYRRVSTDIEDGSEIQFFTESGETIRHFRLIVGTNAFKDAFDDGIGSEPEYFQLLQNYPNPFNASTRIQYQLPEASRVDMRIYTNSGKEIRRLLDHRNRLAGFHTVLWDGRDDQGQPVASGIFFCTLRAGQFERTIKMLMVR